MPIAIYDPLPHRLPTTVTFWYPDAPEVTLRTGTNEVSPTQMTKLLAEKDSPYSKAITFVSEQAPPPAELPPVVNPPAKPEDASKPALLDKPDEVAFPVVALQPVPVGMQSAQESQDTPDLDSMTADEAIAAISQIEDNAILQLLLQSEQSGRKRKTVIAELNQKIAGTK